MIDSYLLKAPIINKVIQMSALVDTTRTFSILISSGVSILDTLDIVIETSSNAVYTDAFKLIYKKIEKGESLGKAFEEERIFPPILVQMTTVGEQTGHLDETLMRISKYFEMESELAVKTMTTLIEPAILLFLGVGVGFLVVSVITPIYSLTSSFK
jgi:type IV pilus assembly protein PilC